MGIEFTKMQALGNDFVVINALEQPFNLTQQQIKAMADRHFGVGFDQMLIIEPPPRKDVDFGYRIFNADGTEVEQCGNGARCLALYLCEHGLCAKHKITLATMTTTMHVTFLSHERISVNMGAPVYQVAKLVTTVAVDSHDYELGLISMGNPHAVLCVEDTACVDVTALGSSIGKQASFQQLGRKRPRLFPVIYSPARETRADGDQRGALHCSPLETPSLLSLGQAQEISFFKNGVNVEFMQVVHAGLIQLRVYERGAGETLACGSGACAAVVYGRLQAKLAESVLVNVPGGQLEVSWAGGKAPVWLTGPAKIVFAGIWKE